MRVPFEQHPTVLTVRGKNQKADAVVPLDVAELRQICMECGADDVGFVEIDRPEVQSEREHILNVLPGTRTLVSLVCRMNRDPVRSPARSVANVEFHRTGDEVNEIARRIVRKLEDIGIAASNPPMAFPMETSRWPERMWTVSHKPIAVAAGMGMIGVHRNVIHPKFGNFILLGTVLVAADIAERSQPIDYNPCLECKLCVAVCPVGAISPDGDFNFSACYHHNYHDFMANAAATAESAIEAKTASGVRQAVPRAEAVTLWQSLGFGPNYQSGFCLAVCPAGEDVIGAYLDDKKAFMHQTLRPLQESTETLYVIPGSDAEKHAMKRFPSKPRRSVPGTLLPKSIDGFMRGLPLTFQREAAGTLNAIFHFTLRDENGRREFTVVIREKRLTVEEGLIGTAVTRVKADAETWLGFIRKEKSLPWAIVRRRIRISGSPKMLLAFARCFPT